MRLTGWWLLAACAPSPGTHAGRPIAPVMSWQGWTWLEREGRAAEEGTDQLLAALDVPAGAAVADVGCGTGFHARRLAKEVGPQGVVYCVDLQPEMLARADTLAAAEGLVNVRTVLGYADRVPLAPASVDLVLMADVFHELSDPLPVLASLREVLAPGGRVALVEFRLEGVTASHIKIEHRMAADQAIREWTDAGFTLVERVDTLPTQHLLLFGVAGGR